MMLLVAPRICAPAFVVASLLSPGNPLAAETPIAAASIEGFVHVPSGRAEVGCLPPLVVGKSLLETTLSALDEVSLDPDLVVVLTAAPLSCSSIYYVPVKNDVRGIGYQRTHESELFDDAPGKRLEGIAFLNDLPYWLQESEELKSAFLHEIGHRWLTRVHARVGEEDVSLTGRDDEHWSYFLDPGVSPLEGNLWSEEDPPVASAPRYPLHYSPLDLYLMGALEPDEVPPLRLLEPAALRGDLLDCNGRRLSPASPPQRCEPLSVPGILRTITVADVIAAEGAREPAAADARRSFSVAFLVVDEKEPALTSENCGSFSRLTAELLEVFSSATDGHLSLENVVSEGASCATLDETSTSPTGETSTQGCAISVHAGGRGDSSRFGLLLLVGMGIVGLRRPREVFFRRVAELARVFAAKLTRALVADFEGDGRDRDDPGAE